MKRRKQAKSAELGVATEECPVDRAPWTPTACASELDGKTGHKQHHCSETGGKRGLISMLLGKIVCKKGSKTNDSPNSSVGQPQNNRGQLPVTTLSPRPANANGANVHNGANATNAQGGGTSNAKTMTFTYAPGSKPLSQYTIRRGVGVGGFGEVYFALSDAGKEVALKRIQRNLEIELRGVSHCLNLKHPNLVALYDICRDDSDQAWVVMEYVNGPNLRTVLDQSPDGLPEQEVRRWFTAVAAGVSHLHSAGLVHRDLKPGNIFDDMGVVKVGDYGLSKFMSASHRGGHTESVGTFHYMAPEIGLGQYGREIDVYALGIVLYELLTGRVPFDGESCHEIIVKHLTASPDLTDVPEPYREVIACALEKDPANRHASVDVMVAKLGFSNDASEHLVSVTPNVAPVGSAENPIRAQLVSEPVARFTKPASQPAPLRNGHEAHGVAAIAASPTNGEPLARAVNASLADLKRWWGTLDRSPKAKKVLLLLGGFVLFINTHWLLPLLMCIGFIYVPYYIIRQMVLHVNQQPTYAQAQRIATVVGEPAKPKTKHQWRTHMRHDLRAKRSIHRAAELSTSWVAATLTVVGLAIVAGVIGLRTGDVNAFTIAPFGWMGAVVLLGSLGILGMGKLWERDEGEPLPRRLVMAGIGAGVGVVAYSAHQYLLLPLDTGLDREISAFELPQALYRADGLPRASALMAHFALLFAIVRWWKPVDPLRRTRLSLWNVAVVVVTAWAVHQLIPIPQPYGMMMAGGMAIAVQMSAPWIDPRSIKKPKQVEPRSPGEAIV